VSRPKSYVLNNPDGYGSPHCRQSGRDGNKSHCN